ncbi:NADH dehydrogenase ubiquinone Fe-S protein 4 [Falsiroseomonas selenitidurans]|uniref:ETC complex I subunit n=1 Tax=Falsiroseomonas selenitidurans TaxID=2716335 RepID=A0ABX1DZE7_9PROT|nr:NADH dehydrogenase ubiquinone Fe-S protein 4 [Falsiroseomonas selenitidurans]NKC30251.1 ETC complex I subunit [Falsiroseomonas selenitidurans]
MSRESQTVRIHRQPKSAMQSGRAGAGEWLLEFAPGEPKRLDPLTGWPGSGDTQGQVTLRFPSAEAAAAYAAARGWTYEVAVPPVVKADIKPKAYADNFRFGRTDNWSH